MKTDARRPEWEERWQSIWEQHELYKTPEDPKDGVYILDMFPYPSAQGLHVGHPEGYTASDIYARFMRHRGKSVLHPMGFDSFGLPAENYAIKTGTHPAKTTADNIDNMRRQIKSLGFSYDWDREVITSDPAYYKWTQWIFVKLFEAGLAYEADAPINWCPKDKTGLANEEVVNGKCERCGTAVTKKKIKQWLIKITDRKYIDRLLNDLEGLDWPQNIKDMQANWIGRSTGAEVDFEIQGSIKKITAFTTRPDTLFGATYMVLSPEHPLVNEITTSDQKKLVETYCKEAAGKSDLERTELSKQKTGVFTGAYAINPVNKKPIPIWIADYVLASYGTGAIMAVPAHDERDHAFAKKYKLPIIQVIKPDVIMPKPFPEGENAGILGTLDADLEYDCWTGDGKMMNSGKFNGLSSEDARKKIVEWLNSETDLTHKTCLIVHGIGGHENENWFPWIKKELTQFGWNTIVPTMPSASHPSLNAWNDYLLKYDVYINENSVLVGHSLGCASLLYYLQKSGKNVDTVILVAPTNPLQDWKKLKSERSDVDWDAVEKMNTDKNFNWKKLRKLAKHFVILHSDNDPFIPQESIAYYKKNIPDAKVYCFPGKKHFSESNGGIKVLPEILSFFPKQLSNSAQAKVAVNYKMRDWLFSRQRYWGEPIPVVHCDHCKKETEATPHYLNFRIQSIWDRLLSGEKTVESRVLNPEEPERYFGNIKKGEVIKCINKNNDEVAYFEVTQAWKFKNIADLFKHQDIIASIKGKSYASEKELRASYETLRPGYADKIDKDGLIAWKLRRVFPGLVLVPEKDLPLKLPDVEKYEPTGTGESPLAAIDSFVHTTCPKCGNPAKRETNTMPQWAGSNWYFLRYTDPKNEKVFADPEKIKQWMPVDMYIGGAEHAVLHLLYARFIYKFLFDLGAIPKECGDEPFKALKNQGLILGEDMQKMSKSRGNVVNPDDVINTYGADVMRMYEMFMGPFEDSKPWSTQGMIGIKRFLNETKKSVVDFLEQSKTMRSVVTAPEITKVLNKTIKKVTEDIDTFKFNTAISQLMICRKAFFEFTVEKDENDKRIEIEPTRIMAISESDLAHFLILLSPFAPHLAEELWQKLHGKTPEQFTKENSVTVQPWPTYDESKLQEDNFTLVVMINGKRRDDLNVPKSASESEIKEIVFARPNVKKWTDGKKIKMEKYVPEKIYTIVVQ